MIVYRLAVLRPHGWENQWFPDYKAVERVAKKIADAYWQVDRMTIPTDRLSMCEALNQAHDAPSNWPGDKMCDVDGRRRR